MKKIGKIKNKKGSVPLGIMVGMLAMLGLMIASMLVTAEKYNNIRMTEKTTSRYLAESAIDIQKYFLHNKLSNKDVLLYFYEVGTHPNTQRVYFKSTPLFGNAEINSEGITDINYATQRVLEENSKYGRNRSLETKIRLYDPERTEDTEIDLLCSANKFFNENPGDNLDNLKCKLNDMYFQSEVKYLGGGIMNTFKVSNMYILRDTFYKDDTSSLATIDINGVNYPVGAVRARLDTENLTITTESFQDVGGVN